MHIVILRPLHQTQTLYDLVKAEGGDPLVLPMVEILAVEVDTKLLFAWQASIISAEILLVTSANAIQYAPTPLLNTLLEVQSRLKIITMGMATTSACQQAGLHVYYTPPKGSTSESLLSFSLLQPKAIKGKKVVILAGVGGAPCWRMR